jgi:pimeloyl-ACP methyl ester carboxylesterase
VLHGTAKVMSSAQCAPVHAAGARLIERFDQPVLFAWGPEDQVFPIANARRYAAALANAEVVEILNAYAFTPEDQPGALAEAIRRCFPPASGVEPRPR